MIQIPNVAEETKEKIKRSSAYSLPHNPTGAGYKPQDIKNALFKPIVDGQNSVLAEVEILINHLNAILSTYLANGIYFHYNKDNNTLDYELESDNGNILASGDIELPFGDKLDKYKDEVKCEVAYTHTPEGKETAREIDGNVRGNSIAARDENGQLYAACNPGPLYDGTTNNDLLINYGALLNYLKSDVGTDISMTMDENTYELTVHLLNKVGYALAASTIDLPLESTVVNASYDSGELTLILKNGNTITFDITDIVRGLVNSSDVQQEVNNSTKPVSSKAVKETTDALQTEVDEAYDIAVANQEKQTQLEQDIEKVSATAKSKQDKTNYRSFNNGNTITVENNTIYTTTDTINNLTILYPTGNFICSFIFTVGDITQGAINFPTDVSKYIGKAPDFQQGETWEINIMNGYVASGKVVSE